VGRGETITAVASSVTARKRTPPRPSRLYKSCAHRRRRGYNLRRGEAAAVARKNLFYEAVPDDLDSHSYIYHVLTHALYCFVVVVVLLAFYILYAVRPLTRSSRYRNKFCENVSARAESCNTRCSHDDKKPVLVCRYILYIIPFMKTTRGHHLHTSYIYGCTS